MACHTLPKLRRKPAEEKVNRGGRDRHKDPSKNDVRQEMPALRNANGSRRQTARNSKTDQRCGPMRQEKGTGEEDHED